MDIEAFFRPWETDICSFDAINEKLTDLFEDWIARGRVFAWRGVVEASLASPQLTLPPPAVDLVQRQSTGRVTAA